LQYVSIAGYSRWKSIFRVYVVTACSLEEIAPSDPVGASCSREQQK
jgi:hypothetical protein